MVAKSSWHTPIAPVFAGDTIRYLVENPSANESGGNADPVSASSIHAVNLVLEDPAAATEWVNTLPDGKAKTQALKNMATNWNQHDPKAVRDWLGTLPTGTRDEVKAHLAGKRWLEPDLHLFRPPGSGSKKPDFFKKHPVFIGFSLPQGVFGRQWKKNTRRTRCRS